MHFYTGKYNENQTGEGKIEDGLVDEGEANGKIISVRKGEVTKNASLKYNHW